MEMLIRSAYKQKLITEDLYPNRSGNEAILSMEAAASWARNMADVAKLIPILQADNESEALARMNADAAGLALGQAITHEDKADILAYSLCMNMYSLVKNVLNLNGRNVNLKQESVDTFMKEYGQWEGSASVTRLAAMWNDWDALTFQWADVVNIGRQFLAVCKKANELFQKAG